MRKALQPVWRQFLIDLDGQQSSWSSRTAQGFIDRANDAIESQKNAGAHHAKDLTDYLPSWLSRLIDHQITPILIDDLNLKLKPVLYRSSLELEENRSLSWQRIGILNTDGPDVGAAYVFAHLLQAGALDTLRRCQSKDCARFFLGPSNKKWCSPRCGSLSRVRMKRKRDR